MPRRSVRVLFAVLLLGCSGGQSAAATRSADAVTVQPAAVKSAANASPTTAAASAPAAGRDSTSLLTKADAGRIAGNASAAVWLIIISDFQCPYCKQWHDDSWELIRKTYVETGKIRVAYVHLPLPMHRNAWPAAQAAMCASVQGKFWPMQDALFRTQQAWEHASDPMPAFEQLAREAGANVDELKACVASDAMRPIIQGDADRAASAGVQSTPTFFVGGKPVVGAQPFAAFREAIDAALAAKPAGK